MPKSRLLYEHQAESFRQAAGDAGSTEKPAVLVTAGTGAGKTESFLLPMLHLLSTEERSTQSQGIRCLILYPMNALVNDQVDRLYGWLKGQERLRLFHFTSETPEDFRAAERDRVPAWEPTSSLIGNEQLARPRINHPFVSPDLMRPRTHCRSDLPHPNAIRHPSRMANVGPNGSALLVGEQAIRRRWCSVASRYFVIGVLACRVIHRQVGQGCLADRKRGHESVAARQEFQ